MRVRSARVAMYRQADMQMMHSTKPGPCRLATITFLTHHAGIPQLVLVWPLRHHAGCPACHAPGVHTAAQICCCCRGRGSAACCQIDFLSWASRRGCSASLSKVPVTDNLHPVWHYHSTAPTMHPPQVAHHLRSLCCSGEPFPDVMGRPAETRCC